MQSVLALGGLALELLGGFLLSIELIWRVESFKRHLDRFRAGARAAAPWRDSLPDDAPRETRIYQGFFRYGASGIGLLAAFVILSLVPLPSQWWAVILGIVIGGAIGLVLGIAAAFVVGLIAVIVSNGARLLLWWIKRDDPAKGAEAPEETGTQPGHPAKGLGQLGFLLLMFGLIAQGVVNFMQG